MDLLKTNMAVIALTGADSIVINGRTITAVCDGDVFTLTYPDNLVEVTVGKNGNAIYALNASGVKAEVELPLIRGSDDDKYFNSLLLSQIRDFSSITLLTGTFQKRIGDGAGNISGDVYTLAGGVLSKNIDAKSNVSGDTEQGKAVYMIIFGNAPRAIE
jgi:hypothetical protein